jgi:aminoglycoside phosphotransferase (APT) family kinase protein
MSSTDDIDPEAFGPLADITEESLVLLATAIAKQVLQLPASNGRLIHRIAGSYNLVHIVEVDGVKLVIRVPATGWGSGMTPAAAEALQSQAATMRLIREKTAVPIPEIYSLDTTGNNEIGAPYIYMSLVLGRPVS